MPSLKDIADGKFKVKDTTSLHYNGRIYRGKKEIGELAKLHQNDDPSIGQVPKQTEVNDGDSDTAAKSSSKTA